MNKRMITVKSKEEIVLMREAGRIASLALQTGGRMAKPGITTGELDREIRKVIKENGAIPSFLNYNGFPASACISVNEEVIHGIPGRRALAAGDIVSIDVGALYKGLHGDCAATFPVGEISHEARKLIDVTKQSFFEGIQFAKQGQRLGDIGAAIQEYAEANGFSVVREYVGHGIGRALHEAPEIPNFGIRGKGVRLLTGFTLAIEPMINAGKKEIDTLKDGWTILTRDRSLAAHYENTILVTDGEAEILTIENL